MDSVIHFAHGAVSGMFGVALSHPIDTIKTCIQDKKPTSYSFRAIYRGVLPAMSGVALEKAIVFGTYENVYRMLKTNQVNNRASIAVSGALSGLTASIIVTPTERFKILAQTGKNISLSKLFLNPSTMFRGLSATFTREVPGFAIYFSTYEYLKDCYCSNNYLNQAPPHMSFLFGGISGAISWFGIYPQDVIKTRMQTSVNTSTNHNFYQTAITIYKFDGPSAFFKGFHFALMRAVPLHAGTFMMMEIMKSTYSSNK